MFFNYHEGARKEVAERLFIIVLAVCGLVSQALHAGTLAEADETADPNIRARIRNVRWVLIKVEGLDPETEQPGRLTTIIKRDVEAKLTGAGLDVRSTADARRVSGQDHLRVHVHKIELERTVYLSSLELVVAQPESATPGRPGDPPIRYTKLSNQLKTVRQKVTYLLNDLIRDYVK